MDAMDFLRKYLTTIQAQLKGLTVSQKLLIALLVVVMIGTIFFTVTLSAKPEMVVLIPQSMSAEEINHAEMYLKGKYDYQVVGDKILVPIDKAYGIRGELFAAQALPKDTTEAFATMVRDSNIFKSESATSREWNVALAETLSKMLRGFPYISDATVVIAQGERSGLGRDAIPSSASVTLRSRSGDGLTTAQVTAIVDMVQGAVAGIQRKDIHVIDGIRSYQAPSEDTPMPADMLAFKRSIEDDLGRKLYIMFGDIPNVKIAVNAIPDLSTRNEEKESYDPKVVKAITEETGHDTSSSEGGPGGEPGVKPNVSAVADSGSGRKSLDTTNETTEKSEVRFGMTTVKSVLPAGSELKDLTASISIPRSYFVSIYRRIAHDPKADPDDDKLQPTIDGQIKRAQVQAMNTIGAASEKQISVDWFDDTIMTHPADIVAAGLSPAGSVPALVGQYAKQGVLGLVALGVLGMMLMMVRRAAPGGAGSDIDPGVFFGTGGAGAAGGKGKRKATDPSAMDVGDDVYGEANSGEAVLTGIELDDDTLQSRKMVDEVSVMIKDSPENAAALVKRWMTKGK
jgi:flagellar biosynthesis/type III secretory pathway M-ring protein FliF/YscJ